MRGEKAIDKAVNAVREVLALKQASANDGKDRVSSISYAQARKVEAFRALTGGQLGKVRTILAAQGVAV